MTGKTSWLLPGALMLVTAACTAGAQPTPGATFSGSIEIEEGASSATIFFTISEDGQSITNVGVDLTDVECETMAASFMSASTSGEFPIQGGKIDLTASSVGHLEGRFTSPTKASGTIQLTLEQTLFGSTLVCELGEWDWSAEAR